MALPAVIFMKLQMFDSIMCRSVKPSFTQIQHTNVKSIDKNSFMHKIKDGFHCAYFHETHSLSLHVCGHLLYQTLSKPDKKCKRCGQNFSYTSTTVAELIFFKVTLPWQIFVGLLFQIVWKAFKCLDVWTPSHSGDCQMVCSCEHSTEKLMFLWPCIMNWPYKTTNVMHWILFIRQILLLSSTCFEYQVLIFRRT